MRATVFVIAAGAAVLAGRPRTAEACSCEPPPPTCEAFWQTDAVFTGEVTAVQTTGEGIAATFQVVEKLRGAIGKTMVIDGGGMCGATFEQGRRYIVYAHGSAGQLRAGLCSRTKPLDRAAEDLAYAHSIPKRKLAVVEGDVAVEGEDDRARPTPRAGAEVRAQGTPHAARTDKRGHYKLELPPGDYTLDVTDPGAKVRWGRLPTVSLKEPAACAKRDIVEVWNGRIQGRLLDHTGKPAANVEVGAYAAGGTRQRWRLDGKTDASGNYDIQEVPPGTFVVAVGAPSEGGPDASQPIPTSYYPGVSGDAKATPLTMTRSGKVQKIDWKLPAPLAVYTISGVLQRDGKPLAKTHVKINNDTWPRGTGDETDAAGRFSFKEVAGSDITLEVCRPDAGPHNYQQACRTVKRRVDRDLVVDLEMPK